MPAAPLPKKINGVEIKKLRALRQQATEVLTDTASLDRIRLHAKNTAKKTLLERKALTESQIEEMEETTS